jgi:enamine deaminase RidA (YjgF/YER057c/UK114 family)
MTSIRMLDLPDLPKKGLYSHAAEVSGSPRTLYIGGRCGIDETGNVVADGTIPQTVRALRNIGDVLRAAGLGYENVVRFTTYLIDKDDIADFYKGRASVFDKIFPDKKYPPNTLLIVDRLVDPSFRVEIDTIAVQ